MNWSILKPIKPLRPFKPYLRNKKYLFGISFFLATLVSILIYNADLYFARTSVKNLSLQLARQIATQAESLSLVAQERNTPDPVAWAATYLNQGTEPKVFEISKIKGTSFQERENYGFYPHDLIFKYFKIIKSEDLSAIQMVIHLNYNGFLGSKSRMTNDAFLLFFFLGCISLIYFILKPHDLHTVEDSESLRSKLKPWLQEAKKLLAFLGIRIRDFLKFAEKIIQATIKSRDSLESLKERIHSELYEMEEGRTLIQEAEKLAVDAEAKVLNLIIETAQWGDKGKAFSAQAEELHKLVQKIRQLCQKTESKLRHLETQIQPWSTDLDIAYQFFNDVMQSSNEIQGNLTLATASLSEQAKHIQKIAGELQMTNVKK